MKVFSLFLLLIGFASNCLSAERVMCGNFSVDVHSTCTFDAAVLDSAIRPLCEVQEVSFGKLKYSGGQASVGADLETGKMRPYLQNVVDSIYCVSDNEILLRLGNGGNCDECEWFLRGSAVTGELLDSRKNNFPVTGLEKAPIFDIFSGRKQ